MNNPQIYILISIIVLFLIVLILILTRKKIGRPLSKLAIAAFMFILAGILFGDNRLMAYSLIGIGIILSIIDIIKKIKTKKNNQIDEVK